MRSGEVESLLQLSPADRLEPLTELARGVLSDGEDQAARGKVTGALVAAIESGAGTVLARMEAAEMLGALGDTRLRTPDSNEYWAEFDVDGHRIAVGRHLVTVTEIAAFFAADGYTNDEYWTEAGKHWRDTRRTYWPDLAGEPDSAPLVVPNQPAIGVTWFEASAYAKAHGARLLHLDERLFVMRGDANRPYPWGQPFGYGNANTSEESLGKPSAVGLFQGDCTPEGVYDLAGNVAEWTMDEADDEVIIHPGSWNQPSMSAWAKARALVPQKTRSADLGFRLARDL
jgi:formylglycine-generating enzyme required for sulfatase activity